MAITSTQSTEHGIANVAVGRYLDSSVSDNTEITVGFKPRYVCIANLAGSGLVQMEWFEGMASDSGLKTSIAGARSLVTSNGITVQDDGFLIGLDTDLLVNSEQLSWMAIG